MICLSEILFAKIAKVSRVALQCTAFTVLFCFVLFCFVLFSLMRTAFYKFLCLPGLNSIERDPPKQ